MEKLSILEEFIFKIRILFIGTKGKIKDKLFQEVVTGKGLWCLLSPILVIEYGENIQCPS